MMLIAGRSFPKATLTNDRFHVHKLYYDAIDELRVSLRWMARDFENAEIDRCRKERIPYVPFRYANGDTRKQLLHVRNISLPYMPPDGQSRSNGEPTSFLNSIPN